MGVVKKESKNLGFNSKIHGRVDLKINANIRKKMMYILHTAKEGKQLLTRQAIYRFSVIAFSYSKWHAEALNV